MRPACHRALLAGFLAFLTLLGMACGGNAPPPTYLVTYVANGADSGTVPVDPDRHRAGSTVTVAGNPGNLVRAAYTFAGWCLRADGTGTSYTQGQTFTMGQADLSLYAKWTLNPTYGVTYDGNGNTGGTVPADSGRYEQGWTVTVAGNPGGLVRTGYTFAGWCLTADGAGTLYAQGQTFAMGAADVTLYAKWTLNPTFVVTYDANGATGGAVPVDGTHYEQGWTVTVGGNPGNLVRTGHTFAGWCLAADGTGTTYTQGQTFAMGAANVTLYARWTLNPTYAVTYDGNGNTGGSVPVDSVRYEAGATVTVLGNLQNLVQVVGGVAQVFGGWNTRADGQGTAYAAGATFAMGSADLVLYARWLPPYVLPTATAEVSLGATSTFVSGTKAYVIAGTQFKVLDLADPLHPVVLGGVFHGFTDLRVEVHAVLDGVAWIARSSSGGYGQGTFLSGIDVSNPAAPVLLGTLVLQPSSSLLSPVSPLYAGRLLVHDYSRNLVYVVDISNPAVPFVRAQWSVPVMVNGGPGIPTIEGNLYYLPCGENRTLRIYDLTDLANVVQVGVSPTGDECYGPAAKVGNFVYVTTRAAAMDAIDVSNPAVPFRAGSVTSTGYPKAWKGRLFTFRDSPNPAVTAHDVTSPAFPMVQATSVIPVPPPSSALGLYPLAYPSATWIGDYLVGQTYGSATSYHATRALLFPVN